MKKRNVRRKKRLPGIAVLLILTETAVLIFGGYTAARYVLQKTEKTVAEASEFYFTSDLLRETQAAYYVDPQKDSFQVVIYNWVDSKRYSSENIRYTVTVENGTADQTAGSIEGKEAKSSTITVTPNKNDETVVVSVSSTEPYTKMLSASFNLALGNQYSVEDNAGDMAAVLTIVRTDDRSDVKLLLQEGVIPDDTDDRVQSTEGGYVFQSSEPGIYSLVLLKTDPNMDLSKENIPFADSIDLKAG